MPIWLYSLIFTFAVVVTLIAGIWLLLHLTALTRFARGKADIVPSPKRPRASRRSLVFALAAFVGGLLLTLTMQVLAIAGTANLWMG